MNQSARRTFERVKQIAISDYVSSPHGTSSYESKIVRNIEDLGSEHSVRPGIPLLNILTQLILRAHSSNQPASTAVNRSCSSEVVTFDLHEPLRKRQSFRRPRYINRGIFGRFQHVEQRHLHPLETAAPARLLTSRAGRNFRHDPHRQW